MPILNVEYTVDVICQVDTDTGRIVSVTEDGESVAPTGRVFDADHALLFDPDDVSEGDVSDDVEVAQRIAMDSDWPAWERGF